MAHYWYAYKFLLSVYHQALFKNALLYQRNSPPFERKVSVLKKSTLGMLCQGRRNRLTHGLEGPPRFQKRIKTCLFTMIQESCRVANSRPAYYCKIQLFQLGGATVREILQQNMENFQIVFFKQCLYKLFFNVLRYVFQFCSVIYFMLFFMECCILFLGIAVLFIDNVVMIKEIASQFHTP